MDGIISKIVKPLKKTFKLENRNYVVLRDGSVEPLPRNTGIGEATSSTQEFIDGNKKHTTEGGEMDT